MKIIEIILIKKDIINNIYKIGIPILSAKYN